MADAATCPAISWNGYRSYVCGKPVKRDGLCGVHAAAKDRTERNAAARAEESERKQRRREESKRLAAALTERLGIEVLDQFHTSDLAIRDDVAREFLGWPAAAQGGESRG